MATLKLIEFAKSLIKQLFGFLWKPFLFYVGYYFAPCLKVKMVQRKTVILISRTYKIICMLIIADAGMAFVPGLCHRGMIFKKWLKLSIFIQGNTIAELCLHRQHWNIQQFEQKSWLTI